ncbi:MAG TPA: 2OG-Fe(II) oxygenase [Burkholderiaceae bacterium]|nr:2OG-Fe(II) oxygenase [Burkholderiaceae bacterium]
MRRPAGTNHVEIRGTRLAFAELVDAHLFDPARRAALGAELRAARPFEHLVADGWFHPTLLRLVREEFDLYPFRDERDLNRGYENTVRSPRNPVLGPAGQIYFGLVNSGWFVELLASITQVPELIADTSLHNGGLHESRRGGRFAVHRDFELSGCTGLQNRMVLLTYLNEDWDPAWNGALELWDADRSRCVRRIEPVLGRTVLMCNGATHFHGHPAPLSLPEGRARRSLATYYYTNTAGTGRPRGHTSSVYLFVARADRLRMWARQLTPPIVWDALKRWLR